MRCAPAAAMWSRPVGLRWISLIWQGYIPWDGRHWSMPFLTVLALPERCYQEMGRSHKKLTDWARQMILQLRRWLPHRPLVLVWDSGCAVLDLLCLCQSLTEPVTLISRLHLDAGLYAPTPPGQMGWPRVKGPRLTGLRQLLDRPALSWVPTPVAWYDGTTRTMELASQTAVVVSLWQVACTDTLGLAPGHQGRTRHPGSPLHQPDSGSGECCGMVCAALATGGHQPGGTRPSGSGNPAPVGQTGPLPALRPY